MNTKIVKVQILIFITIVFFISNLSAQKHLVKNNFTGNLTQYNLEFTMPDGFFEPDTIDRAMYIGTRFFLTNYQIFSNDGNFHVCFVTMKQSKELEKKVRKIFPEYDTTKDYFKKIEYLCKNYGEEPFDEKKINYYDNNKTRSLNADLTLDYFIKLRIPKDGKYKYLKYRFIQNNYQAKVEIYEFYKDFDKKIESQLSNILRFRPV